LEEYHKHPGKRCFIDRWMSLLTAARTKVLRDTARRPIESQQQALEHAAVRCSIENLKTFPFIKERLASGRLRLRGAYFDIADGRLLALDPESDRFGSLDVWSDAAPATLRDEDIEFTQPLAA
jgi:carbonic anhydrase